ncbi:chorismate synthase [Deltaproteobacteria bacterium OttesenSCG-928-K17]|nr:chorismate synthase [Deltaproteobacteria bacterium OttesenSCG-928-K17]
MSNLFGRNFRIMTFGESHGPAMGVVVDGLPAGLKIPLKAVQRDLDRRRPGQSIFVSQRQEEDRAEIVSGLTREGRTNGAPLTIVIKNENADGRAYEEIGNKFRPGHADWTYYRKYGLPPQPGGGRSSGRETVARVAAGALARLLLSPLGVSASAYTVAVGRVKAENIDPEFAERDPLRFADRHLAAEAHQAVEAAMSEGDSIGSVVEISLTGIPAGWGEPIFDKLTSRLGAAFLSIGAVRAVEFGDGIAMAAQRGSQANDPLGPDGPLSNRHGGIMGGISTGLPIVCRLFIRPTPSIASEQRSITLGGHETTISTTGRHDPCLAPRLAPVAEAMALICLADFHLEPNRHYIAINQSVETGHLG